MQTHLEPLERPLAAIPSDEAADALAIERAGQLVRERTGADPRRVRLLPTEGGRVLFLTLAVPAGESLTDAHALAGTLEDELRGAIPALADVVVHTEP